MHLHHCGADADAGHTPGKICHSVTIHARSDARQRRSYVKRAVLKHTILYKFQ